MGWLRRNRRVLALAARIAVLAACAFLGAGIARRIRERG